MAQPILEIKNVSKIYKNNKHIVHALDDISLTINAGEILSLLGVNGAGKTTLSSILATLHPPTSGDVLFHGKSIYQNIINYRKNLGFCPQEINLDKALTVEENLIFAGCYFLLSAKKANERARQLLQQFELTKYASFDIDQLSGGYQRRLLIARSLVPQPAILILDEPTVGLDPHIRRNLWNIIKELKAQGTTLILTTHYLDEAEILSDRVCLLNKGKIEFIGTTKELKTLHKKETLEDVFLAFNDEQQENTGYE